MYTILITGVGAIIGYGLVRSARASSYPLRLVGMDIYEDAVGRHWCDHFERAMPAAAPGYSHFLRDLIIRHAVDLVLPGIEQDVARMSADLPSFRDLPARFVLNPADLQAVASDKWLTHGRLVEAGLPAIPTRIDGNFDELAEALGVPFLLKPRRSYASKGIWQIRNERDLDYWRDRVGDEFMVQQIVGDEDSEYTVGLFGLGDGTCSHTITLQRRLSREGATVKARTVSLPLLEARVGELVALFRPHGPTNMQFRRHGDEFLLLEINPRFSSSGSLRRAFGINEVEICIEYYLGGITPSHRSIRPGSAIRYIEDLVIYDCDHL